MRPALWFRATGWVLFGVGCAGPPAAHEAQQTVDAGPDAPATYALPDPLPARVPIFEASCTDSGSAPASPEVTLPTDGLVATDAVAFALTPFVDADGDAPAATEVEVWRVRDGVPDERVWRLEAVGAPNAVTLGDGILENEGLAFAGLRAWKSYVARARVADDSGRCQPWSAWSPDVAFRTDDGSDPLFDPTVIRTFDITLPPASVQGINDEASPPGCVQYPRTPHAGTLVVDGQTFDGVGVRIKGGCGSSRDLNGKASLKVSLSWDDPTIDGCPVERRFLGQKSLTFNNGVQDPSAKHEMMGYALYRAAGVPAPRVAHAWLRVNGEDYGLYQLVETIDRRFIARFYDNNDGMMYEGAYWCDLVQGNIPETDDGFSCFQREFEPDLCDGLTDPGADPMTWEVLQDLVANLDLLGAANFYPAARELFDFDMFLSMWAVDAVLSHWDGYSFHIVNNYRIYHDPETDLFGMFPWGIDQTFEMGGDVDPWSSSARAVNDCIADPACEGAFASRLAEVVALFEALDFAQQSDVLHERLRAFVAADPRKEYSTEAWEDRSAETRAWIQQRPARVRQYLADHGF